MVRLADVTGAVGRGHYRRPLLLHLEPVTRCGRPAPQRRRNVAGEMRKNAALVGAGT